MAFPIYTIRPALRCLRQAQQLHLGFNPPPRKFTLSMSRNDSAATDTTNSFIPPPPLLDPFTVATPRDERRLVRTRKLLPVGSRRRRAALQSTPGIPFEQLPYQCFQEARKILAADREGKLAQIAEMRKRIAHWTNVSAADCGGEYAKKGRLVRMQKYLEQLKILADINDPSIKKRFEDGQGDMNRPIYRHLADKQWREYPRLILMQRISQHHLVPDLSPYLNPTASVSLAFGRRKVHPGEFVDSRMSEYPGKLRIQVFDKGERLVTIAIIDPDVPDVANDKFTSRCHFLAVNVPVSPTHTSVPLVRLSKEKHLVHNWLPPTAEKGAPYHRLAVLIIQQEDPSTPVSLSDLKTHSNLERDELRLKKLFSSIPGTVVGVNLFRTVWDEGTDGVALRHGIKGSNVEFLKKKPEKLPYKKKDGSRYR